MGTRDGRWEARARKLVDAVVEQIQKNEHGFDEAAIRADEREKASREIREALIEHSRASQAMIEALTRWRRTPIETPREKVLEEALSEIGNSDLEFSDSASLVMQLRNIARRALEWKP